MFLISSNVLLHIIAVTLKPSGEDKNLSANFILADSQEEIEIMSLLLFHKFQTLLTYSEYKETPTTPSNTRSIGETLSD